MNVTLTLTELCKSILNTDASPIFITANKRIANNIRIADKIFHQAEIFFYEDWKKKIWLDGQFEENLLSEFQEYVLWQKVIQTFLTKSDLLHSSLLRADLITPYVQEAWRLLQLCLVSRSVLDAYATTSENKIFLTWLFNFENICKKNHWITESQILSELCERFPKILPTLSKKIFLIGFEQITPQLQLFYEKLKQNGVDIEFISIQESQKNISSSIVISTKDSAEEILTMARWAKKQLSEGKSKIACIVPNLTELRSAIERIFTEVFTPPTVLPDSSNEHLPFNISLGMSLSSYPMIRQAFNILSLDLEENAIELISQLLGTYFIQNTQEEFFARALLYQKLCKQNFLSISLRILLAHSADSLQPFYAPILTQKLQAFILLLQNRPGLLLPRQWATFIENLLNTLGWPGNRTLSTQEYQLKERWQKCLQEFGDLENVLGEINWQTAIDILNKLSNTIIFQPKKENQPIQILGILEAAELSFDATWVGSMNENKWPPRKNPNPFIPLEIQKKYEMPNADTEKSKRTQTKLY